MERPTNAPRSQREYDLQRDRTQAEISKLVAESRRLNKQSDWYPFVAGPAFTGAVFAASKHLFS
jgi:hypothetical protein